MLNYYIRVLHSNPLNSKETLSVVRYSLTYVSSFFKGNLGRGRRLLLRVDRPRNRLRRHEDHLSGNWDGGTVGRRLPLRVLHVRLRSRLAGSHSAGTDFGISRICYGTFLKDLK